MRVIPAIDLLGGRCVRLLKGDFEQATVYGGTPVEVVRGFIAAGATRVHVVDLDAARDRAGDNAAEVATVVGVTRAEVQVAGGVRDAARARAWFERGAAFVVLGTLALEDPAAATAIADSWPSRVYIALDVRGDELATHGWTAGGGPLDSLLATFESAPLAGYIHTDIARDGALTGVAADAVRRLRGLTAHEVILSGGVSGVDDVRRAREAGAAGVIIGRALYEGRIDLAEAIAVAGEGGPG
ncbi:MAG: phosphoribosylformimino-5-aminoimidazole carboxamide ribotide isomerase [Chloroflexota bacterium]|jgi:phosphoribosylformimino-5-aminoimidazole carboxamide ribotide isomerase|nr:phosphoribosylformimino-5-aminoimidazole carboxamide ribotide isomerase [Chloroflexota bacterium]